MDQPQPSRVAQPEPARKGFSDSGAGMDVAPDTGTDNHGGGGAGGAGNNYNNETFSSKVLSYVCRVADRKFCTISLRGRLEAPPQVLLRHAEEEAYVSLARNSGEKGVIQQRVSTISTFKLCFPTYCFTLAATISKADLVSAARDSKRRG